jgi:hypothetical protein
MKVSVGGRQSGRTARAMADCPKGAVYVWYNHHLDYPKQLAKFLGREDLKIVSPSWLSAENVTGKTFTGVRCDHAFDPEQRHWYALHLVKERIVKPARFDQFLNNPAKSR